MGQNKHTCTRGKPLHGVVPWQAESEAYSGAFFPNGRNIITDPVSEPLALLSRERKRERGREEGCVCVSS